jgi:hypothetical protein
LLNHVVGAALNLLNHLVGAALNLLKHLVGAALNLLLMAIWDTFLIGKPGGAGATTTGSAQSPATHGPKPVTLVAGSLGLVVSVSMAKSTVLFVGSDALGWSSVCRRVEVCCGRAWPTLLQIADVVDSQGC